VAGLLGAERYERTGERAGYRNGYRVRTWDTRVGTIELAIPKVKPGSYFPSLLEPRRRAGNRMQPSLRFRLVPAQIGLMPRDPISPCGGARL
jgi:transposase-like protein